jgi:ArsR family transcriptional regulator, arsenate/arsenite/antimonite-responsive transcriptional repressor
MNDLRLTPTPDPGSLAVRLSALGHPARIRILQHLANAECCCCKDVVDCLGLAQSTVSQHLKVLVDAGLVAVQPSGQRSNYRVDRAALSSLSGSVGALLQSCCAPAPANPDL